MEDDTTPLPTFAGRLRARFEYGATAGDDVDGDGALAVQLTVPPRRSKRKAAEDEDEPGERDDDDDQKPSATPSPRKRKAAPGKRARARAPTRYAPPATYAHLPLLPDALGPDLLVLFVGLNPGLQTARCGHAYAHPSNRFWHLLHAAGITPGAAPCPAHDDHTLPARFRLGLTNIVARPTRNGAELRPDELDAGVAVLEAKVRRWRPAAVCLVGKGIWDSVVRVRHGGGGRSAPAFHYGWQDATENFGLRRTGSADHPDDADDADDAAEPDDPDAVADGVRADPDWKGARLFVATSTSGLAAHPPMAEKLVIWRQLGEWVEQQRLLDGDDRPL